MVIHFGVEREASLVKNPTVKVYTELSFSSYIFKLKSENVLISFLQAQNVCQIFER